MAIGTTVKVGWDATKVNRGMSKLQSQFRNAGQAAAKAFKAVSVAAAAAAAATVLYFNKFRKEIDRFGKLATRLNETPETIQRIALAAKLAGTDIEGTTKALQRFVGALFDVSTGSGEYTDALEVLNLNAQELMSMSPEKQLIKLADAYERAGQSGKTLAALKELLGRGGPELVPLLAQGADKLRDAFANANVVSNETVRKVERFNDALTKIGFSVRAAFGEAIGGAVDRMVKAIEDAEPVIRKWAASLSGIIAEAISGNLQPIEAVFSYLARRFGEMLLAAVAQGTTVLGESALKGGALGVAGPLWEKHTGQKVKMFSDSGRFTSEDFQGFSKGMLGSDVELSRLQASLAKIEQNTLRTADNTNGQGNDTVNHGGQNWYPLAGVPAWP